MNRIKLTRLSIIEDEKGPIMHALKNSDDAFKRFGEIYFSEIYFGKIKGWKRHLKMHMNLIVPEGLVKFVFYDAKLNNFEEYEIGIKNYFRISVPPGLWFAFKGLEKRNLVMNIADIEHDPNESEKKNLLDIRYSW